VPEDGSAVAGERLAELDAVSRMAFLLRESCLALPRPQAVEAGRVVRPEQDGLASSTALSTGSAATASRMRAKACE
jgi:hypothetical protein